MLIIPTVVQKSSIEGLGLFTTVNIQKGQLIWRYDPVIDLHLSFDFVENHSSEEMRRLVHCYGYVLRDDPTHWVYNCDNGRFFNHVPSPLANTADTPGSHAEGVETSYALRDIQAGEELTCDYHLFATPNKWQPWLDSMPKTVEESLGAKGGEFLGVARSAA